MVGFAGNREEACERQYPVAGRSVCMSVCTFDLHAVDLRDGGEVFLEVFDGVAHAGLLNVGEGCCQLGWGAVGLWSLRRVLDR